MSLEKQELRRVALAHLTKSAVSIIYAVANHYTRVLWHATYELQQYVIDGRQTGGTMLFVDEGHRPIAKR